jgi:hypothetical protein
VGIRWSRLDAELVAFRILHDGDVVVPLTYRGAQGDQAIDFLAHAGEGAEVKVHSVGCRRWSATTSEPDVRATPARCLDVGAFGSGFLIHVGDERGGPEPGDSKGVLAVKRQVLDERWHTPPAGDARCTSVAEHQHLDELVEDDPVSGCAPVAAQRADPLALARSQSGISCRTSPNAGSKGMFPTFDRFSRLGWVRMRNLLVCVYGSRLALPRFA